MTKRELGESYFKQGYNCAQAVALAFENEIKLSKDYKHNQQYCQQFF